MTPVSPRDRMRKYREKRKAERTGYLSGTLILPENLECGSLTSFEGRKPTLTLAQWFEDWKTYDASRQKHEREVPVLKYCRDEVFLDVEGWKLGVEYGYCTKCGDSSPKIFQYVERCYYCGSRRK